MPTRSEWIRSQQLGLIAAASLLALVVGVAGGSEAKLGLVIALGAIFVVLVLTNLKFGFAAMVVFAYLAALSVQGGVSIAKLAGALIVVAWIASASLRERSGGNFFTEHPALTYLVLAFLAWSTISTAWAPSRSLALEEELRYVLNAFLIPVAYAAIRDGRDVRHVLAAIVFGATIAALSAIANPPSQESAIYGRAAGTVGDPNELASVLVVGLAVAASFAVNRFILPPLRVLSGFAGALCLAGILVSLSRGGLLGLCGALIVAVVVGGRWRGRVFALCVVLLLAAVAYFGLFASLPAKERVLNVSGGGGTGRLDLWTVGSRMIEAHPLNGIGVGQFATSSVHYLLQPGLIESGKFILSEPKVAHNTYLNVTAELGIVGGLLFVAILIFCMGSTLRAVRYAREAGDERMEILYRGLVAGIAGFLVTLMFLSADVTKMLWILVALGPAVAAAARADLHGWRPAGTRAPASGSARWARRGAQGAALRL